MSNPFDHTGTLDTTGYGLAAASAMYGNAGTTYGSTGVSAYGGSGTAETSADNAVDAVCPAFRDSSLAAHAAARTLPSQRSFDRTY